ncbi:SRPBCC family protein [Achromobacter sp. UMC46]|uniref:SRPBCC family protein n=1 Tax=Achromobacter sp. UMC46 TaxID=1862319 RepID=UPI0016022709|nr:SRPBCC family protein [Achromobacter sp. UMC46]MBB1594214.1 polyketide cyclase [Achromobacter sp. UMC46]
MLKTLLLIIVAAIVLLLAYAATRPDTFRVERSAQIQAPPERLFPLINDLQAFNTWNPYEKKDPAIKGRYGASTVGPGATYAWESEKVGVGEMRIESAQPNTTVGMRLTFVKPFAAVNQVTFSLTPADGGTRVVWAMEGRLNFVAKLMHIFFNMDRMVGQDFEDGLTNLKALAEKRQAPTGA